MAHVTRYLGLQGTTFSERHDMLRWSVNAFKNLLLAVTAIYLAERTRCNIISHCAWEARGEGVKYCIDVTVSSLIRPCSSK
jgi:hypothetical protein